MLFLLDISTRAVAVPKLVRLFMALGYRLYLQDVVYESPIECFTVMVVATDISFSNWALPSMASRKHIGISILQNHINLPALNTIARMC